MIHGTWSSGSTSPGYMSYTFACGTGEVAYIVGGIYLYSEHHAFQTATISTYNINTGESGTLGVIPVTFSGITFPSGGIVGTKMYVMGNTILPPHNTIYAIDIETGSVETKNATLPPNLEYLIRGAIYNKYIYVFGGGENGEAADGTVFIR